MRLSKEDMQEFEKVKHHLQDRIERGFEWPARTGLFAQFRMLEKEIGADAMDDTENAAFLVHMKISDNRGKPDTYQNTDIIPVSCDNYKKEFEHYKSCKRALIDFDNDQAYQALESERDKLEEQLKTAKLEDRDAILKRLDEIDNNAEKRHKETSKEHKDIKKTVINKQKTKDQITQSQAAEIIKNWAQSLCIVDHETTCERTIRNWERGKTKQPRWYPGRNYSEAEFNTQVLTGLCHQYYPGQKIFKLIRELQDSKSDDKLKKTSKTGE